MARSSDCLELILAQEPQNAQALNALGVAWQAKAISKAIECWQKAVSINPEYADVWQNIALAHEHLNQLPEAIAAHQKVVTLRPQDSQAHRLLGMAQLDYSLLPAANQCFERALELDPNDPENIWQRFFIRALVGDFPGAWQDYSADSTYKAAQRQTTVLHNRGGRVNRSRSKPFCSMPNKALAIPSR